jgi:hypothetical protein
MRNNKGIRGKLSTDFVDQICDIYQFLNQDLFTKSIAPIACNSQLVFVRSKAWSSPKAMSSLMLVPGNFCLAKSTNV